MASLSPRHLSRYRDIATVKVDAVDEQELLDTVHKLANRVTASSSPR